jgi:5-methylcytosine-specific restriction protein A
MARRPCLTPRCAGLAPPGQPRCTTCEQAHQRERNATRSHYHGDWAKLAREAVAAHRATHGDWCPGWRRPPHPATDLTADHIDPRSLAAGIRILCRGCNSRRGNTPDD